MEKEELLLIFSCLALFFDLIQLSRAKPSEKRKLEYGFYAAILACGLTVISYLMLVQSFLNDDFSMREVYSYSSSGLPAASKFYATWGGASSSMLFLTFLIGILYLLYRSSTYKGTEAFNIASYKILNFILFFFLVVTLMASPFARFPDAPADGRGLNPLLQSFWMIVHPPIIFAGYVFVILAFVLTLAGLSSQEIGNTRLLRLSLQAAWLATTLGIAIGGVWAYEVLGWGGYWAWDPVETASLLPWLALTAYFHLVPLSNRGESLARELMVLIAFEAVIFTTALTRGGLLVSVHAYAASPIGPVFLLLALGTVVYFFYLKRDIKKPLHSLEVNRSSLYSLSFLIGYWSLIFIFLVCFWGIAFPIITGTFLANPVTTGSEFYNNWIFPFAMGFVAALVGCSIYERIDLQKFVMLVVGALSVGVVLVQVQMPTPNTLANLGIPLLIVALFAVTCRLLRVLAGRKSLRLFARSLLHLGIIVTLVGVFLSSTTKEVSEVSDAKPNTDLEMLGLTIALKNFTVYAGTGNVHSIQLGRSGPEYSALKLDVAIEHGGGIYHGALWTHLYTIYGVVSTPLIINTWTGDIYIHMHQTESMYDSLLDALMDKEVLPEDLMLTAEMIPMVHLVWAGVALMSIGVAMPLIWELVRTLRKKASAG